MLKFALFNMERREKEDERAARRVAYKGKGFSGGWGAELAGVVSGLVCGLWSCRHQPCAQEKLSSAAGQLSTTSLA